MWQAFQRLCYGAALQRHAVQNVVIILVLERVQVSARRLLSRQGVGIGLEVLELGHDLVLEIDQVRIDPALGCIRRIALAHRYKI